MDKMEFVNGSTIEPIENAGENTRSKRGQEQIDNLKIQFSYEREDKYHE